MDSDQEKEIAVAVEEVKKLSLFPHNQHLSESPPENSYLEDGFFVENFKNGSRVYDGHTLFLKTGVAREEQIAKILADLKKDIRKIVGHDFEDILNVVIARNVETKTKEYTGYAYWWVSSENAYWILSGRNPDGSERNIRHKPGENAKKENILPPLVIPGYYEYDEEQYQYHIKLAKEKKERIEKVPRQGSIIIYKAYIDREKTCASLKACSHLPVPADKLYEVFSRYSRNEKYPKIIIGEGYSNDRKVYNVQVQFDRSDEAGFALLMNKKTTLLVNGNKYYLNFDFIN